MLFMGQEFGERAPFDFFTSHSDPELVRAVRRGRRDEHRSMGLSDPPDPQDEATFLASKLDWTLVDAEGHKEMLALHRDLIALRKHHPALSNGRKDLAVVASSETPRFITVERRGEHGDGVMLLVNLEDETQRIPFGGSAGTWDLALATDDVRFGGTGPAPPSQLRVSAPAGVSVPCPGPGALIYAKSASRS
jgi:maltooligosyltrehalose trehalohydrolase